MDEKSWFETGFMGVSRWLLDIRNATLKCHERRSGLTSITQRLAVCTGVFSADTIRWGCGDIRALGGGRNNPPTKRKVNGAVPKSVEFYGATGRRGS